jgi:hypothetical protein
MTFDPLYPGTAWERLHSVQERIQELVANHSFINQEWETIRRSLLWAGGLRDLPQAIPGQVRMYYSYLVAFKKKSIVCSCHGWITNWRPYGLFTDKY